MFYKSSNSLNEELEIIFFKLHNGIYTGGRSYFYQNSTGIGSKSIVEFLPIVGEIRNAADASKKFGERVDSGGLDKEGSGELMYDRGDLVYVFKFDKQTVVGWRVTVR